MCLKRDRDLFFQSAVGRWRAKLARGHHFRDGGVSSCLRETNLILLTVIELGRLELLFTTALIMKAQCVVEASEPVWYFNFIMQDLKLLQRFILHIYVVILLYLGTYYIII